MPEIRVNQDLCTKCGICVLCCPATLSNDLQKAAIPDVLDTEYCIECGHCVAICPYDAIVHEKFPDNHVIIIKKDLIPKIEQTLELLRSRRSIRQFEDKPVEKELIEKIIEAARFAPSAHNSQSTRYLVIQDRKVMERITELTTKFLARMLRLFLNPVTRIFFLRLSPVQKKEAFKPTVYIDIEEYIEKKKEAMAEYKSELKEYPHPRSIEGIDIQARKRGIEVSIKYAECFELIRKIVR